MKTIQITKNKKEEKTAKIIQLNVFGQTANVGTSKLINAVLCVSQAALWPQQVFTKRDQAKLLNLISDHFYNEQNSNTTFNELMQRICLVKRYVSRKKGRYVAKPQDWLNIHYPLGLSGTNHWLAKVKEIRLEVPEYNKGISLFAKAIQSYIENPTEITIRKYRQKLVSERQFDLLQLFYISIINLQYSL